MNQNARAEIFPTYLNAGLMETLFSIKPHLMMNTYNKYKCSLCYPFIFMYYKTKEHTKVLTLGLSNSRRTTSVSLHKQHVSAFVFPMGFPQITIDDIYKKTVDSLVCILLDFHI